MKSLSFSKKVKVTRRTILTFGLLMVLAGLFIFNQGSQVLVPIAELTGLVTHIQNESPIMAPTLISVPPSNHSYVSADLSGSDRVQGMLQVSDGREIAFYVMNEGNFSLWRAGHPAALLLAQPLAISYNFTITPSTSGTYFFVFDNEDSSSHIVIFNLSSVQNTVVLNPLLQYAGFELLLVGAVLCFFGLRGGKRKDKAKAKSKPAWKCRFCGAKNVTEDMTFCTKCRRAQA